MSDLKAKVTTALQEVRILVLGSQILLGFQYNAVFRPGFDALPWHTRWLNAAALGLILCTLGMLLAPAPFHRIVERGESTVRMQHYTSRVATVALLPLASGIAIDVYIAFSRILTTALQAGIAAAFAAATALVFWYGIPLWARETESMERQMRDRDAIQKVSLKDKIEQMLTEARVILPGAQALLGFQFAAVLTESFEKLPPTLKYAHGGSLALIALAVILLMAPAPFHRIVARGEDCESVNRYGVWVTLAAMLPLAMGLMSEVFVVVTKIAGSEHVGLVSAAVGLFAFVGLWYGYPLAQRWHDNTRRAS